MGQPTSSSKQPPPQQERTIEKMELLSKEGKEARVRITTFRISREGTREFLMSRKRTLEQVGDGTWRDRQCHKVYPRI